MRRNPPSHRLFERSAALEKFLVLMDSPIADNVSVPQLAGVTIEAHSWLVLSDAKCGLSTAQTLHSTLRRVKRVSNRCKLAAKLLANKETPLWLLEHGIKLWLSFLAPVIERAIKPSPAYASSTVAKLAEFFVNRTKNTLSHERQGPAL